ncbi:MAG: hypothetical protein ABSA32_02240 [Candidatus Acidiferrales bacterium]|jgi:Tfp pilus assembly protein PilV
MSVQMAKLSWSICIAGVVGIGLLGISAPPGQSQMQTQTQGQTAQPLQRALVNLYEVAKSIIANPKNEAEEHPGGSPTFPYPDAIQAQWDASTNAYGKSLTQQERDAFMPCATHLNNAIADMEKGYTTVDTQPKTNTGAQESAQKSYADAKTEFAQCDAAYALAQSEIGNGAANKPQQGGADTNASPEPAPENPPAGTPETPTSDTTPPSNATAASNGPIDGSVEEAEQPGSIDWTPTLDPLFGYLSKEWNLVTSDPKNKDWARDNDGSTLTLKLQPDQAPEMVSVSGARGSSLRTIMESGNVPVTKFPNGSRLSSVVVAPKFLVKPTPGKLRTRMKYYERDGIFKSYQVAQ